MPILGALSQAGGRDLRGRAAADADWFLQHSKYFYPIISAILGSIFLICIYLLWRGPLRRKFPCFSSRQSDAESASGEGGPAFYLGSTLTLDAEKVEKERQDAGRTAGAGWREEHRRANFLLSALEKDREARRERAVGRGKGQDSPGLAAGPRKITKLPKSPMTPRTPRTPVSPIPGLGHGRSPSKAAHAVSTAPTTSSFGHAPDQYTLSTPSTSTGTSGSWSAISPVYAYPQPQAPRPAYSPAMRTPRTPYSPPSAYPTTPPTAYMLPPRPSGPTSGSSQHYHPYPIFDSAASISTPHLPQAASPPSSSRSLELPLHLANSAALDSSSRGTGGQPASAVEIPWDGRPNFSRPLARPAPQGGGTSDRQTAFSTASVYSQASGPALPPPLPHPSESIVGAASGVARSSHATTASHSSTSTSAPSLTSSHTTPPRTRSPTSSSPTALPSRRQSAIMSSVPLPSIFITAPPPAKAKRASVASSARLSMRGAIAPSPLRQSMTSLHL